LFNAIYPVIEVFQVGYQKVQNHLPWFILNLIV